MLEHEDLKWIAATSTELNSTLQQISRYADLARQHKGEHNYVEMLAERVEIASKSAQAIFDRVTSKILARSSGSTSSLAGAGAPPPFKVMPPPVKTPAPVAVGGIKPTAAAARPEPMRKPALATREANESAPLPISPEIKILNPKGARELILLVDDELEIVELASEMLTEEGYKVILAKDGFEALRIYQQIGKQIGLIILDFFLPVMDGDAVFDEFRALNPNVNVVLSSGFAEQGKLSNMLAQGLRGFIPKPYSREKLLEQIRSTLDAARQ